MATSTTKTNKPILPRGNDQSPKGYNRAELYSGKALDFDGVNDKVDLPTLSFDLYAFSFYYEGAITTGSGQFIFHTGDGTNDGISIGSVTSLVSGETLMIGDSGNYTAVTESFDDAIHFIVCTWNATENKYNFYLNAQKLSTINSGTDAPLISLSTAPAIGYRKAIGDMYLNGKISNVRAFSTALTAAQVADLYNNPEKIVPTGVADSALKLWLPMQEGAGTTAYDGSGNGNHGTISGATWTHGIGAPVSQTAVIDWNKGTNEVVYSEEFNNWAKTALVDLTANDATAPDGSLTADKIQLNATGSNEVYYSVSSITIGYTLSVYVKKNTARWFSLGSNVHDVRRVWFDLDNGVVGTEASGYTGVIEQVGTDGWYRCAILIGAGASVSPYIDVMLSSADGVNGGTIGDSVWLWGGQVEQASSVGPYVRTGATAQTSDVLLPQGLTAGRDITGVNLFENVRKQGALNLDGNSWAEVHDNASLDITDAITLECWINSTDKDQYHHIISKSTTTSGAYAMVSEVTTGYLGFQSALGTFIKTDYNVMDGNWNHIVLVYDEVNAKFYINGALDDTIAYTTALGTNDVKVHIGARGNGIQLFESDIAQPRIYNRALTAAEVLQNYNSGKSIYTNS